MSVELESKGPCRKELKIEVPASDVQNVWSEVASVFMQQAQIKGFRPGKAPKAMVLRQYGKKIREAVRDELLPKAYHDALKEQKLDPVMVLDVKEGEVAEGQPFSFTVLLDVAPDFVMPAYKGVAISGKKISVSDEDVEGAILRFRQRGAKYEDATESRPVQTDDMVVVDYVATLDGKPLEEVSEKAKSLGKGADFYVLANEEYSFLPGFGPALIGMEVGESKNIDVTFDDRFTVEELRGKKTQFAATVKKIRERILPPLDEAFFKQCQVADLAELQKMTRDILTRQAEDEETTRQKGELLDSLLKQIEMELPESVVQEETQHLVYDIVRENTYRGASEDAIKENREKIFDSAERSAKERVKIRYVLQQIAQEEKIETTEAEVTSQLARHAAQEGLSVSDWLKKVKRSEHEIRDGVRKELRDAKTLDFLLKNAAVTEK